MVCKATMKTDCLTVDQFVAVTMAQSKLKTFVLDTDIKFKIFTCHTDLSSKQELHFLLNESLLMKELDHPNIVGCLGVCFDTPDGYLYLILPFMGKENI